MHSLGLITYRNFLCLYHVLSASCVSLLSRETYWLLSEPVLRRATVPDARPGGSPQVCIFISDTAQPVEVEAIWRYKNFLG